MVPIEVRALKMKRQVLEKAKPPKPIIIKEKKNGYHNTSIIILLAKAVQQWGRTHWNTKKKFF